jgi:hypothetical protein
MATLEDDYICSVVCSAMHSENITDVFYAAACAGLDDQDRKKIRESVDLTDRFNNRDFAAIEDRLSQVNPKRTDTIKIRSNSMDFRTRK